MLYLSLDYTVVTRVLMSTMHPWKEKRDPARLISFYQVVRDPDLVFNEMSSMLEEALKFMKTRIGEAHLICLSLIMNCLNPHSTTGFIERYYYLHIHSICYT